jgi:hypothetical protein
MVDDREQLGFWGKKCIFDNMQSCLRIKISGECSRCSLSDLDFMTK